MRSSSIFALMAAFGLCLSVGTASASQIDSNSLATTGSSSFGNAVTANTSFTDIFDFTMPSSANTGGTGVVSVLSNSITFTDLSIWQSGNLVADWAGSQIGGASIGLFNFTAGLTGWSVHVSGNPDASAMSYGGSLSVSPVPEPKTYAMLLAGLGLLAFTARRRKTSFF